MPEAAIILLIEVGAAEAIGAGLASLLGAGTIPTVAATAIGAGTISAGMALGRDDNLSQVLKSAVIGGVSSYAGSAIAGNVASSVSSSLAREGVDNAVANAMGRVLGGAAGGAIRSGTSALLTNKDPVAALLQGGITGGLAAGVAASIDTALKDAPGFGEPANAAEAGLQRAVKAALATTVLSGGDISTIGPAVLNSFISGASKYGSQMKDDTTAVRTANNEYQAALSAYDSNIGEQNKLVEQYNTAIAPLNTQYNEIMGLKAQYDSAAYGAKDWGGWAAANGYIAEGNEYGGWTGNYVKENPDATWHYEPKQRWVPGGDEGDYLETYQEKVYDTDPWLYAPAPQQLAAEANRLAGVINPKVAEYTTAHRNLFGGTYTETETIYQKDYDTGEDAWYVGDDGNYYRMPSGERDVERTVVGSLEAVTERLGTLKKALPTIESTITTKETNLETAVAAFNTSELLNASLIQPTLNNLITARQLYAQEFGADPSEDTLQAYVNSGDIIKAVTKDVTDHSNETLAISKGFDDYADYKAAGNLSPSDYYAKEEGWKDSADKLAASVSGYTSPDAWNTFVTNQATATKAGFDNYADYQAAGDTTSEDFYAQRSGWKNAAQKTEATQAGFTLPSTWTTYQTEQTNAAAATAAGFNSYSDMQEAGEESPANFYAKKEGWTDAAEKQTAQNQGYFTPKNWDLGQKFAQASSEGWFDYSVKQRAISEGFNTPKEWEDHLNEQAATEAGFPDFATRVKFGDSLEAYQQSLVDQNKAITKTIEEQDAFAVNKLTDAINKNPFLAAKVVKFTDEELDDYLQNNVIPERFQTSQPAETVTGAEGNDTLSGSATMPGEELIVDQNVVNTEVASPFLPVGSPDFVGPPLEEVTSQPELNIDNLQSLLGPTGPNLPFTPSIVNPDYILNRPVDSSGVVTPDDLSAQTGPLPIDTDLTSFVTNAAQEAGLDDKDIEELVKEAVPEIQREVYGQESEPVGPKPVQIEPSILEPIGPEEFIPLTGMPAEQTIGPFLPREPIVSVDESPVIDRDVISPGLDLNSVADAAQEAGYSESEMQDLLTDLGETKPVTIPGETGELTIDQNGQVSVSEPVTQEVSPVPIERDVITPGLDLNSVADAAKEAGYSEDETKDLIADVGGATNIVEDLTGAPAGTVPQDLTPAEVKPVDNLGITDVSAVDTAVDTLQGAVANDTLTGAETNDTLQGAIAEDTLTGAIANDTLQGAVDTLLGGDTTDRINASGGTPIDADQGEAEAGLGTDLGVSDYDTIEGAAGNDEVRIDASGGTPIDEIVDLSDQPVEGPQSGGGLEEETEPTNQGQAEEGTGLGPTIGEGVGADLNQPDTGWPDWLKGLFRNMVSQGTSPAQARNFAQGFLGSGTGTGIQSPGMLGPTYQPWYSEMPEFDITKAFSPTLYAMREEEPDAQAEEE